jgi:hypothetical protein
MFLVLLLHPPYTCTRDRRHDHNDHVRTRARAPHFIYSNSQLQELNLKKKSTYISTYIQLFANSYNAIDIARAL